MFGSPGLVVVGGASWPRGRELESQRHILWWINHSSHLFVAKLCWCLKRPKIHKKRQVSALLDQLKVGKSAIWCALVIGFIIRRWDKFAHTKGSGCGSVGRVVASDTRGPQFESSHQQKFINIEQLLYTINCVLKRRKITKKRPGMAHFFKKKFVHTWTNERTISFQKCQTMELESLNKKFVSRKRFSSFCECEDKMIKIVFNFYNIHSVAKLFSFSDQNFTRSRNPEIENFGN